MMMQTADLLDARTAAEMLHVSRTTLTRLIQRGILQPVEPHNSLLRRQPRHLFRRSDVERLAAPMQRAG